MDKARAAREKHGNKLLLCVGGAGRSAGLHELVNKGKTERRKFVRSVLKLIDKHKLDGLDVDFEVPASTQNQQTWKNLANLLKDLSVAFKSDSRKLSLTMAYHPMG